MKDAKTLWDKLSVTEKEKYEDQAKTSSENYKAAITNWKIQNEDKLKELMNTHKPELDQLSRKFKIINMADKSDVAENNNTTKGKQKKNIMATSKKKAAVKTQSEKTI